MKIIVLLLTIGSIFDYFLALVGIDIMHGTVENFSISHIIYTIGIHVSHDRPVGKEIHLVKTLISILSVQLDNRVRGGVPRRSLQAAVHRSWVPFVWFIVLDCN